jgi:siroheme synthase
VIVSQATGSQQQVRWSSVARLAREERLPAPALLIVGRVASREIAEISATCWSKVEKDRIAQKTSVI